MYNINNWDIFSATFRKLVELKKHCCVGHFDRSKRMEMGLRYFFLGTNASNEKMEEKRTKYFGLGSVYACVIPNVLYVFCIQFIIISMEELSGEICIFAIARAKDDI